MFDLTDCNKYDCVLSETTQNYVRIWNHNNYYKLIIDADVHKNKNQNKTEKNT